MESKGSRVFWTVAFLEIFVLQELEVEPCDLTKRLASLEAAREA